MNLTPHYIIISKIINRISFKTNWFYRVLPVKWIIRKKAGRFIKETNKACLQRNLKRILGSFQEFPETLKKSDDAKIIFDWADKTLRHEFDYLGSGLTKLDPIDWHIDFKSGFCWSKGRFYKKYVMVDLTNNADVKVPWELSRCHHLLWLGEAYLITKDEKYAREVIDQIEWWIEENPLMYSINWTCAMDVAIRVVNWMYAINMIISSVHVTDVFSKKLSGSLFEHGFFIYNNLEKWYPYSANHYAANITGLLYLGQLFIENSFGKKWWNYALKEFFLEIRLQVLPSGAHFERSISYHRLMTELFAYPYFMLKRIQEIIPLDIHQRIESMFGFVDNYTKPNGLSPLIGDNDDGRFLPFVKRDFRDHRYLLNIAGSLFGKNYANQEAKTLLADNYFLLNQTKRNDYNAQAEQLVVRDHRDAGFVILRKNKLFLFFTNSSLSGYPDLRRKMHGTHTHADYLSFELSIGEDDFIIDPGSYVYTASAKIRNEFRSTKMHNTVTIDNLNQIGISESKLFLVRGFNEPDLIDLHETNTEIEISGTKQWNIEGENTVLHSRKLNIYDNSKLILSDAICCNNRHSLNWYFHLAFDVEAVLCNKTIKMVNCNGSSLNMSFNTSNDFSINIIDSEYSPSYGVLIPTKVIQINIVADNNFILKTIIDY